MTFWVSLTEYITGIFSCCLWVCEDALEGWVTFWVGLLGYMTGILNRCLWVCEDALEGWVTFGVGFFLATQRAY
jgi:hypothetical protein